MWVITVFIQWGTVWDLGQLLPCLPSLTFLSHSPPFSCRQMSALVFYDPLCYMSPPCLPSFVHTTVSASVKSPCFPMCSQPLGRSSHLRLHIAFLKTWNHFSTPLKLRLLFSIQVLYPTEAEKVTRLIAFNSHSIPTILLSPYCCYLHFMKLR